jgi:4'-phosphopantetheinyl transferase
LSTGSPVTTGFFPSPHEDIFCLLQSLDSDPRLADAIAPPGLLSPEEQARYEGFHVLKRRRDWLLGRWTAKHLVRAYLGKTAAPPALDEIVIRAHSDGSPYAALSADRLPLSVSISHSGPYSLCALTGQPGASVGADIEMIEPRPLSLAEQFFTRNELDALLASAEEERTVRMTLVWSAKEAFLKSIKEGLRVDTREIVVETPRVLAEARIWEPLVVTARSGLMPVGAEYRSWWRRESETIVTLGLLTGVSDLAPADLESHPG